MQGFSDFEIVGIGTDGVSRIGYLEEKSPEGRLTPSQEAFLASRAKHGAKTCVAKSMREVEEFLRRDMLLPVP